MARLLSGTLPPRRSVAPRRERGSDWQSGPRKLRRNRNLILFAGKSHGIVFCRHTSADKRRSPTVTLVDFPIPILIGQIGQSKQLLPEESLGQGQPLVRQAEGVSNRHSHPLAGAGARAMVRSKSCWPPESEPGGRLRSRRLLEPWQCRTTIALPRRSPFSERTVHAA